MKKLNKEPATDKYRTVMANYLASGQDEETATISTVTALILLNYTGEEIRRAINTVSPDEKSNSKNKLKIFEAVAKDKRRIAFLKSLPWEEEEMKQAKQYRDNTEPDIDIANIANINLAAVG